MVSNIKIDDSFNSKIKTMITDIFKLSFKNLMENFNNKKILFLNGESLKKMNFFFIEPELCNMNIFNKYFLINKLHLDKFCSEFENYASSKQKNNNLLDFNIHALDLIFFSNNNIEEISEIYNFEKRLQSIRIKNNKGIFGGNNNIKFPLLNIYIIFIPKINTNICSYISRLYKNKIDSKELSNLCGLDLNSKYDIFFKAFYNLDMTLIPYYEDFIILNEMEEGLNDLNDYRISFFNNDYYNILLINSMKINDDYLKIVLHEKKYEYLSDFITPFFKKCLKFIGKIEYIYSIGENSEIVKDILNQYENEFFDNNHKNDRENVVFIFDRSIDFLTPLLNQISYKGSLDDNFEISSNKSIKIIAENNIGKDQSMLVNKKLSIEDEVMYELEDEHFNLAQFEILEKYKLYKNRISTKDKNNDIVNDKVNEDKSNNLRKISENLNELNSSYKKYNEYMKHGEISLSLTQINNSKLKFIILEKEILENFGNKYEFEYSNIKLSNYIADSFYIIKESAKNDKFLEYSMNKFDFLRLTYLLIIVRKYSLDESYDLINKVKEFLIFENKNFNKNGLGSNLTLDHIKNFVKLIILHKFDFKYLSEKFNLILSDKHDKYSVHYSYNGYCPLFTKLIKEGIKYSWKKSKLIKYLSNENKINICYPKNEKKYKDGYIIIIIIGGITFSEYFSFRALMKKDYMKNKKLLVYSSCKVQYALM